MYHANAIRWGLLLIASLVLVLLLVNTFWVPAPLPSLGSPCLEIPVISPEDVSDSSLCSADYSDCFLFNGEKAAIDKGSKTIYIPQTIQESTSREDLTGALTISVSNRQLYFLEDSGFENLSQSVAQGHAFPLAVTHGNHCHLYRVVFTTMPVLRMDSVSKTEREGDVPLFRGQICLWDTDGESPVISDLLYNARGNTTLYMDKQSWKLSLKDDRMKNRHLSLLGLGADDDWILNAMSMDDTNLKEMFFTQVWNSIAQDAPWDYPMAECRYVEVILNGSYNGVYLLQRRVDQKYLGLSDEDILLKGTGLMAASIPQNSYKIKSSPLSDEETYALMEGVYNLTDVSLIKPENFLDISLFLQFGSLRDNYRYKNMYYCLDKKDNGYSLSMIPWDTDMGLGVKWVVDHIGYDYDAALGMNVTRVEYPQMLALYPDLEERMRERWQELRQDTLETQNLVRQMEALIRQLSQSGAHTRDIQRWGEHYGGPDTQEAAMQFLLERLTLLDSQFS